MNRLLKGLKDFGLIIVIDPKGKNQTINICHGLKKADIPVGVFQYSRDQTIDQVKISNENEDMFIGAQCSCDIDEMQRAMASGAHFIFSSMDKVDVIKTSLNRGYDLIIEASTKKQIDRAVLLNIKAIEINCALPDSESLIEYTLSETNLALLIRGEKKELPINRWRNHKQLVAFIVEELSLPTDEEEVYAYAVSMIHKLLGLEYSNLSVKNDSPRLEEAKIFTSLTGIPLLFGTPVDLLTINVADMDRTIAYLKWKNIFMDPLSAKMDGNIIVETDLYTRFLGWTVKLVNKP